MQHQLNAGSREGMRTKVRSTGPDNKEMHREGPGERRLGRKK